MTTFNMKAPLEAVNKLTGKVVPVTLERVEDDGCFTTVECPDPTTTPPDDSDGEDCCGIDRWYVRNRAGFQVGRKVYFRNGREGMALGNLGHKGYDYAVITSGGVTSEPIVIFAYEGGRKYSSKDLESPDDFAAAPYEAPVSFTFRNVYADGTGPGGTAHKSLETTKMAAKVGKTRIGILKIGTDGSAELLKCVPAVRTDGYGPATWTDA